MLNERTTFEDPIENVLLCYAHDNQQSYREMEAYLGQRLVKMEGYSYAKLQESGFLEPASGGRKRLIVLDDMAISFLADKRSFDLFAANIHHSGLCIILCVQNIFYSSPLYRSVSQQASFLIVYPSLRANNSLRILSRQLFGSSSFLPSAMAEVAQTRYSYLLLDLKPYTDPRLRVRSSVCLPGVIPICFQPPAASL